MSVENLPTYLDGLQLYIRVMIERILCLCVFLWYVLKISTPEV